jgi:peptidoglycan/LPS O-acetylase OafA/YrhL
VTGLHVAVPVTILPRQRRPWGRRQRLPDTGRDQYIDSLRALALVRVVTYHTFGWAWLPVAFPSMGIMFALGGSLVAASLARAPGRPGQVLRKRVRRLLPPLWLYGAVVVAVMARHGWTFTDDVGARLDLRGVLAWLVPLEQPPGSAWGDDFVIPLWYIRTYLWLLLLSPALYWLFRRYPRATLLAPGVLLALLATGLLEASTATGDTLDHLGIFGACWILGFAHHDGTIGRLPRRRTLLGGAAVMALGVAWALTHQQPDSGWNIDEIDVADALYCAGAVLLLLRLYPRPAVLARLPRLARLVTAMNARAMTIYLWGNLAIWAATPVLESNPWTVRLEGPGWTGQLAQYVTAWLVLAVAVVAVGWAEDVAAGRPPRINPWPRAALPHPGATATATATAGAGRRRGRPRWSPRIATAAIRLLAATLVLSLGLAWRGIP